MNSPTIGFVVTSEERFEHVNRLAHNKGCRLIYLHETLEDALEPAERMVAEDGVEVILSRRGTAHMLRHHVNVPVISLPDTNSNLLRAVKKAKNISDKVAITVFQSTEYDMDLCREFINIFPFPVVYYNKKSMEKGIISAKKKGIKVVIGGGMTRITAERHGLYHINIHSTEDINGNTFDNLINVINTRRIEIEKNEKYYTILNNISDGIISVDCNGCVNDINIKALIFLKREKNDIIGKKIQNVLQDPAIMHTLHNGKKISNVNIKLKNERFLVTTRPIVLDSLIIGAVYSLQPAAGILLTEKTVRKSYNNGLTAKYSLKDFWHKNKHIANMLERVQLYAGTDSTVLITGESGTGKELVAQGIHQLSPRSSGPFVSLNCSAMPELLLESELFGYAEGAFTGSQRGGKIGIFELAQGGTLFLDEIASISPAFQTRLLRVLQEKEVMRIGSNAIIPVDVRVIAASNRNLVNEVKNSHLREDLYFRLNVLSVAILPLRERREDIILIFKKFLRHFAFQYKQQILKIPDNYMNKLYYLDWPGNVRQLQNFTEQLVVLSRSEFNGGIFDNALNEVRLYSAKYVETSTPQWQFPKQISPQSLKAALASARQSKTRAAQLLGVSRTTLWRMCKRFGM